MYTTFHRLFVFSILAVLLSTAVGLSAAEPAAGYLFSYFKGNGEDGLHLAYSSDGYHWQSINGDRPLLAPRVGENKLMRDPSIVCGPDGVFHMVWTTSWDGKTIGCASSRDLIHWSKQKGVPVMASIPTARNTWAPDLFYDPATEQYLIVWASTIPERFTETAGSSEDRYNHRLYFTTTRDFESFAPVRLFFDPGFSCIDGTIVRSGEKYVLIFKNEQFVPPQKNLHTAVADRAEGPYGDVSAPLTDNVSYWAEGPTAVKIGDRWFLYFDKYNRGSYGLMTSPDLKSWTDESTRLEFPDGARHGTVFGVSAEIIEGLLKLDEK